MWAFLAWQLVETATVHSGYDFLGGMADHHDKHHERFTGNFGAAGWMDRIFGTGIEERKVGKGRKGE